MRDQHNFVVTERFQNFHKMGLCVSADRMEELGWECNSARVTLRLVTQLSNSGLHYTFASEV
jgi:hypothetical protein